MLLSLTKPLLSYSQWTEGDFVKLLAIFLFLKTICIIIFIDLFIYIY